jgi:hypothetical protein
LIEFETDKWDLDDGDKKNLAEFVDDVCDAHAKNPNATVVVEGHADARGPAAHKLGHTVLVLHENATSRSWPHASQWQREKPRAKTPQSR